MAFIEYLATAPSIAQVAQKHIGSTTNGHTFTIALKYEDNTSVTVLTHVVDGVDAGSDTAIAQEIVDEFNALTHELATPITASRSGAVVVLTADTAGQPFYITYAGTGTWDNSGATNTANSGQLDWNTAANWSTGAVPVSSDKILIGSRAKVALSSNGIVYGLYQTAVNLAELQLPYGAPDIGSLRFPLQLTTAKGIVGAGFANVGLLTPATCQHINAGSAAGKWEILATSVVGVGGYPPFILTGTSSSNVLSVSGVSYVGFGLLPYGVTAAVDTVTNSGSGRVTLGETVTAGYLTNSGTGDTVLYGTVSNNLYVYKGTVYDFCATTLSLAIVDGSTSVLVFNTRTGATDITSLDIGNGGKLDLSQDSRSATIDSIAVTAGQGIVKGAFTFTSLGVGPGGSFSVE